MMKKNGTLCFTPAEYSFTGDAVMHIMQDDGVGVYDNNINLQKCIDIPVQQEYRYVSSSKRTRTVKDVVRTAVIRSENLTNTYIAYAASEGKDFAQLTYAEQQQVVQNYDAQYGADVDMREEDEFTLFMSNYNGAYFNYSMYQNSYPKLGVLLDKDGEVYRFAATYQYEYTEWSDYNVVEYDTIKSEKNILSCIGIDSQGDVGGNTFCLSSTLFNEDEELEYIRPVYSIVDVELPVFKIIVGDVSEEPVTFETKSIKKDFAIKGLEIVSESGVVLSRIDFDEEYSNIGNYLLLDDNLFLIGIDITVLQLGENRFISFDTCSDEADTKTIYKHFYKIDTKTNSIDAVKAPVCIKTMQSDAYRIEVESSCGNDAEVELSTVAGQKCAMQKMVDGRCFIDVNSKGTYIITLRENGVLVGGKKILVK